MFDWDLSKPHVMKIFLKMLTADQISPLFNQGYSRRN